MTFRHIRLVLKVLLFLVRAQRSAKTMAEATERDKLEAELNHEISQIGLRNQVL